jgi:hypothetical protein
MIRRAVIVVLTVAALTAGVAAISSIGKTIAACFPPPSIWSIGPSSWTKYMVRSLSAPRRGPFAWGLAGGRLWIQTVRTVDQPHQNVQRDFILCRYVTWGMPIRYSLGPVNQGDIEGVVVGDATRMNHANPVMTNVFPPSYPLPKMGPLQYEVTKTLTVWLWGVAALLLIYPIAAFIRGPVRRWRRRRRGLCRHCGYDLTGNVSGVCPECGKTI